MACSATRMRPDKQSILQASPPALLPPDRERTCE